MPLQKPRLKKESMFFFAKKNQKTFAMFADGHGGA
jgi:hypothetical protein